MPNKAVNSIMTSVTILYTVDRGVVYHTTELYTLYIHNSQHTRTHTPPRSSSLGTGRFCRGCETCDHSWGRAVNSRGPK